MAATVCVRRHSVVTDRCWTHGRPFALGASGVVVAVDGALLVVDGRRGDIEARRSNAGTTAAPASGVRRAVLRRPDELAVVGMDNTRKGLPRDVANGRRPVLGHSLQAHRVPHHTIHILRSLCCPRVLLGQRRHGLRQPLLPAARGHIPAALLQQRQHRAEARVVLRGGVARAQAAPRPLRIGAVELLQWLDVEQRRGLGRRLVVHD